MAPPPPPPSNCFAAAAASYYYTGGTLDRSVDLMGSSRKEGISQSRTVTAAAASMMLDSIGGAEKGGGQGGHVQVQYVWELPVGCEGAVVVSVSLRFRSAESVKQARRGGPIKRP